MKPILITLWLTIQLAWAAPPNIIFLMTDDQRADSLGCTSGGVVRTPHLDSLAKEGALFNRAYTTTSICMTSRACVLTGQHAARHRIRQFNQSLTEKQLRASYLGLLQQAGYYTGFIGKWGVGNPASAKHILNEPRAYSGQGRYFEKNSTDTPHLTARLGDQAIQFIKSAPPNKPFHLSVSFKAPHCQDSSDIYSKQFPPDPAFAHLYQKDNIKPPLTAADKYYQSLPSILMNSLNRDRWAVRFRSPKRYQETVKNYYRLISGVDHVVGRIRDELKKSGMEKNTIIIFTSDHGFFLGEFGLAGKWLANEVSIRVPLIIYDPRLPETKRGKRYDQLALLIDMAPTMLDFAEIKKPDAMQGQSLIPITHDNLTKNWRRSFFYEHWFSAGGRIPPSEAVCTESWKYIRYLNPKQKENASLKNSPIHEALYHLSNDPHEITNLAQKPEHIQRLQKMRQQWAEMRQSTR